MIAPSAQGLQVKHIVDFYIKESQTSVTKATFVPFSFLPPCLIFLRVLPKPLYSWMGPLWKRLPEDKQLMTS